MTVSAFSQELEKRNYQLILAQIWRDVSYNFYDPYRLKEIRWDSLYNVYSQKIPSVRSERDYCQLLRRFLAEVQDGHTELRGWECIDAKDSTVDYIPVTMEWIGEKLYVTHVLMGLEKNWLLNSEILSIDGQSPDVYYKQHVDPYRSANTLQYKRNQPLLLCDTRGDSIAFNVKKDGEQHHLFLSYNAIQNINNRKWKKKWLRAYPVATQYSSWKGQFGKDSFYFLRFDAFRNKSISQTMNAAKAKIETSDYVVLDLRYNHGGNEMMADTLLMYFANSDTLRTYKSVTRIHNALKAAKGLSKESQFRPYYENLKLDTLSEEIYVNDGNIYHIDKPTFVLISGKTCSAAEDFLIALKNNKLESKIILIGTPTAGTTGAPLVRSLSNNIYYRICTRFPLIPEGMFDNGIQPDYYFELKIDDLSNDERILSYVNQLYNKMFAKYEK